MKRLAILIAALFCFVPRASAQISFVSAVDGGNNGGTTNSLTFSFTVSSGSNRMLAVGFAGDADNGNDDITSVTYGGTALTLAVKNTFNSGGLNRFTYLYFLLGPATGTANVIISCTNNHYLIATAGEWDGVLQSGQPDVTITNHGTNTSLTTTDTTLSNNPWAILVENGFNSNNPPTAGAGVARRTFGSAFGQPGLFDSNGPICCGSFSLTTNRSASTTIYHAIATFKPVIPAPAATGQISGQVIAAPLLPQVTPTSTFPGEQATVLTPANGAALTTDLTGVACGTTIRLTHGVTYSTATAFPLTTNCTCRSASNVYTNSQWIIIESDQYIGGSVRGTRIDPSAEYGKLAYISSTDTNYAFLATNNSAGCYWFLGLGVLQNAGNFQADFSFGDTSSTNWAHDFVVDHSYVHGTSTENLVRCVQNNANFVTVIDSYLSDCHKVGQDSQAIVGWDALGGVLIQNNFIEGATENFMEGGAVPTVPGICPSDFTIQGNHFFKPLAWRIGDPTYAGIHWSVKNLYENKNICRELITKNVLQNNWADSQNGVALLFDIENVCCGGTDPNPAAVISDVNMFYNIVQNAAGAAQLASSNSNASPLNQPVHRWFAHDNLYYGIDECLWGGCGAIGNWYIVGKPPTAAFASYDATWNHETIASANMSRGFFFDSQGGSFASTDTHYGYTFTNSIIDGGGNGVFLGNGTSAGNQTILNYAPTANFTFNCAYNFTSLGTLPNVAHSQTPANQAAIFVNPGTDFHVAPSSVCHNAASDGLDMGANINAVNSATAGVVQALANPVTVTNVSPSTFTHTGGTGLTITGTNFLAESGLGVIVGGAGPISAISTDSCGFGNPGQYTITAFTDTSHFTYTGGCVVVMASPVTVALNDTINKIVNSGQTSGTINRYTPGNACTSVMVTSSTTITCNAPAATGTVTTGPVSVFVSQWGIPVQSTVFGNYN